MKLAIDSSSFAKRYIKETGSNKLDILLQHASELALSIIVVPEIISALNRRLQEHALTDKEYQMLTRQLLDDVHDATILQLTPAAIAQSVKLLEMNVLQAMDALHVACALEWKADLFVTSDKKQLDAAMQADLQCEYLQHTGE
ncbi:MAG: type II toxin-antitoxin system VapC family toxin [Desulfocapsa sp.]|uniref:Type II toxin-antitoxin system VapC family toxin n=1 Tax=Desulfotalea psychrophila TaxID=84980 RepID=A0ABS3AVE5_9BACT|nr:type II toxin-antitoxin system VapC family toxin [Desulfocapsa sp.]MBN4060151.1 type II toxin-antitoxin system VapC family toxin [Desulfotalea psychrophila]MBN4068768.1 type II toxin-antitoxin system VapC family toxin [Desulfotalea psychrophila]